MAARVIAVAPSRKVITFRVLRFYAIASALLSIAYSLIFTIIPYQISFAFRDWLHKALGSDGMVPNYTWELGNIFHLNALILLPTSIFLLSAKKWYAILAMLACFLMMWDFLYWSRLSWY